LGFRYASKGNRVPLRNAAFRIVGASGKDDPRAFGLISEGLSDAVDKRDFALASAAADSLVTLGDARGLAFFDDLIKKTTDAQIRGFLSQFQERLRRSAQGAASAPVRP